MNIILLVSPTRAAYIIILMSDYIYYYVQEYLYCNCSVSTGADYTDTSREMQFKGVTVKPSESLIAINLVINLPPGFSEDGDVTLYKMSSDGYEKQLDNASMPSCQSTCWFELTVGVENLEDSMDLRVEFTHRNDEFVRGINPMIVLYTYMDQPLSEIVDKRRAPDPISRQHRREEPHDEVYSEQSHDSEPVTTPLSEIDDNSCSKQTVRLGYSQMRWLGVAENIELINPPHITFEFCYGPCNIPLVAVPYSDLDNTFNKRTRVLEVANLRRSSEHRLNPPPSCIPLSYTANEVIYAVGNLVAMTTFPSVVECGCRL